MVEMIVSFQMGDALMADKRNIYPKPFLRWAGGKSWLIKYLDSIVRDYKFNCYHEPFLGGGSIFFYFASKMNTAYLSDFNNELIDTYSAIKNDPDGVILHLEKYVNTAEEYYRIRALRPETLIEAAARFIYLNQTSFNGIYRVNTKGEYNVPYGNRTKDFIEADKLRAASKMLQSAILQAEDFDCVRINVAPGDLVFLDPPYTVSHNHNGFIKYNQKLFSLEDQYRLKALIDFIKKKGAYYILTNAAHATIYEIFYEKDDRCLELSRASLIGGENAKRGKIQEYIFTNL
mgnify:FL=1